jgi:hypothetical protein
MNEIAVQVSDAYKLFGNDRLDWRWPWRKSENGQAAANGDGSTAAKENAKANGKTTVAVDHLDIYNNRRR